MLRINRYILSRMKGDEGRELVWIPYGIESNTRVRGTGDSNTLSVIGFQVNISGFCNIYHNHVCLHDMKQTLRTCDTHLVSVIRSNSLFRRQSVSQPACLSIILVSQPGK